ncbi:hypothetical protein [Flagellimonas algicola]|uniref:Lipoprotein n=1 Tax=Flagellimonas algicola TaxID=2583815 RepID=A0ABY2WMB0_9FLAO|nr:hypothetical protein [Allomuricauda algicola]TMU55657.1 hypothetical protein FGG15_15950 [Allomuricauda algicola]
MKLKMYFTITLVIFLIVFYSCLGNNNTKTNVKSEAAETSNNVGVVNKSDKEKEPVVENGSDAIRFLKSKGIVGSEYSDKMAMSYESKVYRSLKYCLLKLNYDESLGNDYSEDPVINFLYIKKGEDLINLIVLYTINEEDLTFSFNIEKIPFYKYYDSSTGWHKYYSYLPLKENFIETRQLDESEEIKKESIRLGENLGYQIKSSSDIEKFTVIEKPKVK